MKPLYRFALIILLLASGHLGFVNAQAYLPIASDNFMGINQALLQPASIVDNRCRVDVNLAGYSSDLFNNMYSFKSVGLLNPYSIIHNDTWWNKNADPRKTNGTDKKALIDLDLMGPSFLVTINPKHAIGFTFRARHITNAEGVGEPLAYSIDGDFHEENYWDKWYHNHNIRDVQNIFADYGISYATEVLNTGEHYMKAGLTFKIIQGIGGAYIGAEDMYYYATQQVGDEGADHVSWNSEYMQYGASDNWDWQDDNNGIGNSGFRYTFIANPTIGLDLGAVYEFRPKYEDYRYDMDGEKNLERRDLNKYLVKVGLSILDIGRIRYKKQYGSQDFTAAQTPDYYTRYQNGDNSLPDNTHWMNISEVSFRFPPFVDFSDTLTRRIALGQGWSANSKNDENFTIPLPTAISLQADVNVVKGFYVNLTTYTALHTGFKRMSNSHYVSSYTVTPRYEHKWFSVMMPISYGTIQRFNVGLGLRAAFVYMGINNIFNWIVADPYGTAFYFGIKVPIWFEKPPSDRDHDGVSDNKDRCIDAPGTWENMGCPDRDGDGVVDIDDKCPDEPGLKVFQGCPDRDGDGVPDYEDDCPDAPGPKITKGCPDRDGDGVIDSQDECPDVPGPKELNGCPDRDGDGVPDYKDRCPDEPGPPEQGGCPFVDTDGDGVKDSDDHCPTVPGPPENFGCPYTDTDGDGVIDKDDRCPLTPGDPANFGCPIIKTEEAAVIKTAFENLEFETGKSVIRSSSFASLDELANLLISKPAWKLKISGHTDNVGSDASNMTLSKNRAQATAKYLQGKGVAPSQLITEWFGETKPIADNSTPEGRQKNRRVEMEIVFD